MMNDWTARDHDDENMLEGESLGRGNWRYGGAGAYWNPPDWFHDCRGL